MSLHIEKEYDLPFDMDFTSVARQVTDAVIEEEKCPYECEINLFLVDNEGIRELNREYRQIDAPTDVLSFPMLDGSAFSDYEALANAQEDYFDPETGELLLGDIVISLDKVLEQAENYGHSRRREYAFLIAHSMLHLFGYDHMTEEEACLMEDKQRQILERIGIGR